MQNTQEQEKHQLKDAESSMNSSAIQDNSFVSQSSSSSKLYKKKKTLDDYEVVEREIQTGAGSQRKTHFITQLVKEKGGKRERFAMNIINKKELKRNGESESVKNEIKIQKKLNHSHIIRLYEAFEDEKNIYTICEHAKNGTLKLYLSQKKKLKENEAFVFVFQTCIALDYLHKKSIIHCDINPGNMLLTEDGNIKLTNFGRSVEGASSSRSNKPNDENPQYMAPELISDEPFDFRVDIWNVGIILFEMIHGFAPFRTKEEILQGSLKFEDISLDAKNLLFSLLRPNPDDRLELLSIFNDPWMMKHQQEFKIDYNQYLYKSALSKTPGSSRKPQTSSESLSQTTPVKATDDRHSTHENPFTSPPPRKTLPSQNNLVNNEQQQQQSYKKQNPDTGLEMSFEDKRTTETVKEEVRQIAPERVSSSDVSLMRKSKSGERASFITSEKIHSPKKKQNLEEKNKHLAFGGTPQKEREKENIIDNPELAREWLDSRKADKDLDYSFMPKSLLYSSKTLDQSYSELKRKTKQLETMMGGEADLEIERVSRSSWKNVREDTKNETFGNDESNNHGLFSRFLSMIGCVQRDNDSSKRNAYKK